MSAACRAHEPRAVAIEPGIVRINPLGCGQARQAFIELALHHALKPPESRPGGNRFRVDFKRSLACGQPQCQALRRDQIASQSLVKTNIGDSRIGHGILRVDLYRGLEPFDRAIKGIESGLI